MHVTKSQHFVPQKYLKSWATDGQLVMKYRDKIVPNSSPENVGQQNYFYKLEDLNYHELYTVVQYLREKLKMPEKYLQMHLANNFIPIFSEKIAKGQFDSDSVKILDFIEQENLVEKSIIKILQIFICASRHEASNDLEKVRDNLNNIVRHGEEDSNCQIEKLAWSYLDDALVGNLEFFNTERGFDCFVFYMIYQLFRTPKYLSIPTPVNSTLGKDSLRKICTYIRLPTALQVHGNLLKSRVEYDLLYIDNQTELEFITGDLPVINLDSQRPPEFLDLFFPISPKKALFFGKKGRISTEYQYFSNLNIDDVDKLNRLLCSRCVDQIYASTDRILIERQYQAGKSSW